MYAQDLLKDVSIIFITPTIVWSMSNNREGTQPLSTENWIKNLLSMALHNRDNSFLELNMAVVHLISLISFL